MKKQKNNRKRCKISVSADTVTVFAASVFGCAVSIAFTTLLAIVCSIICLFSKDPDKLITPLAFICVIISFFICGFVAAKKRRAAIPCGLFSSSMLTAVMLLASLCINDSLSSNFSPIVSILIRLSFIAVSLVGALLATNTKKRAKRKR